MADDRLKKETPTRDERAPRALQDRAVTENRQMTDDERLKVLSSGYLQIKLPNLPEIDGYHVCWLSTNNPGDTIAWRLQLGYELLTPAEVPGWQHGTCAAEQYTGYVGVNEMLGAKIRLDLWHRIMKHLHHDEPSQIESGIRSQIDAAKGEAEQLGTKILEEEGTQALGKYTPAPASW
jgi:hypothetical protein